MYNSKNHFYILFLIKLSQSSKFVFFYLIFLQLQFSFAVDSKQLSNIVVNQTNVGLVAEELQSLNKAQLKLTHLLFSQVFQSYFEEGDGFVISNLYGNGERGFKYLLEKKFFTLFLDRWEQVIEKYGDRYVSTMSIFKTILSEPGFLHENQYMLKLTLGITENYLEFGDFLASRKFQTKNNNSEFLKDPMSLGLKPYIEKPTNLGYARVPFLLRVLASENLHDPEQRSLALLDEISRMMAYEKKDRKTYLWSISFFLNSNSKKVVDSAQRILKDIGRNEIVDIISDSRWFFLGGARLWNLRESIFTIIKSTFQTEKIDLFVSWLKWNLRYKIIGSPLIKEKILLPALSFLRSIKITHPIRWAGVLSTTAHVAFAKYFMNSQSYLPTIEEKKILESIEALKLFESESSVLQSADPVWQAYHPSIRNYIQPSPYKELQSFEPPVSLDLLNQMKVTPLLPASELLALIDKRLLENNKHEDYNFDYGHLFIQDEYYRALAQSEVRDLRLISMANAVRSERHNNLIQILEKYLSVDSKKSIKLENEISFNQLNYEDFRLALFESLELMRAKHTYYYSGDSRSLIRELVGEGGNCVAVTMFQLSLLSPLWGFGNWKLGIVFKPGHVLLVAFSEKQNSIIQLDDGSEQSMIGYSYLIYHPDLFLAAARGEVQASDYILKTSNSQKIITPNQFVHVEDTLSEFGFAFGNLNKIKENLVPAASFLGFNKMDFKNLINNGISNIVGIPQNENENRKALSKNPEFLINKQVSYNSNLDDKSKVLDWKNDLKSVLINNFNKSDDYEGSDATLSLMKFREALLSLNLDLKVTYLDLVQYKSFDTSVLIPIFGGNLGYFYLNNMIPQVLPANSRNVELHLFVTNEQLKILTKMDLENFIKTVSISILASGKNWFSDLNGDLDTQIHDLFIRAQKNVNAGILLKDPEVLNINKKLLRLAVFRQSINSFSDYFNILNYIFYQDRSLHSNQIAQVELFIKIINDLKIQLNYPKKNLILHEGREAPSYEDSKQIMSGAIMLNILLLNSKVKFNLDNPFRLFSFQKQSLSESLWNLCRPISIGKTLIEKLVVVPAERTSVSNDFIIFFDGTKYIEKENPIFMEPITVTPDDQPIESLALRNDIIDFCHNHTDQDGLLDLLTAEPKMFRAQFLLSRTPLSFSKDTIDKLYESAWISLYNRKTEWEIEIPIIEKQVCAIHKSLSSSTINLPKVSKEFCDHQPRGKISDGLFCVEEKSLSFDNSKLPNCLDEKSPLNFLVNYQLESPSDYKENRKRANSKTNLNLHKSTEESTTKIPFENILSLFSKQSINKLRSDSASNSGSKLNSVNVKTSVDAMMFTDPVYDNESLLVQTLLLSSHFNDAVARHVITNRAYYNEYWATELSTLCSFILNYGDRTLSAYHPFVTHGVCYFENPEKVISSKKRTLKLSEP